jgi:nitrite reductase/ring-hydroxylating ferredoxin subunit
MAASHLQAVLSTKSSSFRKESKMNWIKALPQDELPNGHRRVVAVGGRSILLLNHDGQLYAVDNECPHMGASLGDGEVTKDGTLICPRHHSAFDLQTGAIKEWSPWPPGVGRVLGSISKEKALPVYPTRLDQGSIWVGAEDPG